MVPEILEGFDTYNNNTDLGNGLWNLLVGGVFVQISTAKKRTSSRSLYINGQGSNGAGIQRSITARTAYYMGVAFYVPDVSNTHNVWWGYLTATNKQYFLRLNGTTKLLELVYNSVVVWTDTKQRVFAGAFYYGEFFVDIVAGEMEFRFNGSSTPIVQVSGLPVSVETLNAFQIVSDNRYSYHDDLYVQPDRFLGAQRCYTQFVDGDDVPQDWAGVLAPNYTNLNAVPYNAADYISTPTVNAKSQFTFQDVVSSAAIVVVNSARITTVQSLDAAGSGQTQCSIVLDAGATILPGNTHDLTTSDVYYEDYIDLSGKTLAQINAGDLLIERTA